MPDDYPYNDDLLIEDADQAHARSIYPAIASALIFPNLTAVVKAADLKANKGKRSVWNRGIVAVVLVTASLLMASAAPLYAAIHPWSELVAILAAIFGISGGVLAILNRQTEWLEQRLVTESVRQFHFRYLIESAAEIVSSAENDNFDVYFSQRELAFNQFVQDFVRRRSGALSAIVDDPEAPRDVIENLPKQDIFETVNGKELLLAYRNLRILRQRNFAEHKLTKKGTIFSKFARDQAERIGQVGIILLALLFLVHIGSALFVTLNHEDFNKWFEFIGISIALLALALRAIEEGLKPKTEIERYRHYQAVTRRALEEFDNGDTRSKLEAVKSLERAAYDELSIFLKSHEEAGFKM